MGDASSTGQKSPWLERSLALGTVAISIAALGSTAWLSWNANRLQQGDNTINVIAAYGGESVRESRSALYAIARRETNDPARRAWDFAEVASLRGALGFVATCYRDGLCLAPTVIDYFCVDVVKYDDIFGKGAPEFQSVIPAVSDVAFNELVEDCRVMEASR